MRKFFSRTENFFYSREGGGRRRIFSGRGFFFNGGRGGRRRFFLGSRIFFCREGRRFSKVVFA